MAAALDGNPSASGVINLAIQVRGCRVGSALWLKLEMWGTSTHCFTEPTDCTRTCKSTRAIRLTHVFVVASLAQAGISGQVTERYAVDRSAADNKMSQRDRLAVYKQQSSVELQPCPIQQLIRFEAKLSLALLSLVLRPHMRSSALTWEGVPTALLRPAVWAALGQARQLVQGSILAAAGVPAASSDATTAGRAVCAPAVQLQLAPPPPAPLAKSLYGLTHASLDDLIRLPDSFSRLVYAAIDPDGRVSTTAKRKRKAATAAAAAAARPSAGGNSTVSDGMEQQRRI